MERGVLQLTIDDAGYTLRAGDSVYYEADCHHRFVNPGREPCVYYLAMALAEGEPHAHRRGTPPGRRRS
jgi:mannose-6-phosphate isomerase-like protein (cupin superfamily)